MKTTWKEMTMAMCGVGAAVLATVMSAGCSASVASPSPADYVTSSFDSDSGQPNAVLRVRHVPRFTRPKPGASCPANTSMCGGECVTLDRDPINCGACGTVCGAGEVCAAGTCVTSCQSDEAFCTPDTGPSYCARLASDNDDCGQCGVACGDGTACHEGVCTTTCGAGQSRCDDADAGTSYCADLASDNASCGACGHSCDAGLVCSGGACVPSCGAGQLACGGGCVDPATSMQHCGASDSCDVDAGTAGTACARGQACSGGVCTKLDAPVGSFQVGDGPDWWNDPTLYTCVQACAVVFGGDASQYSCSTSASEDDHMAWASEFGSSEHCAGGTPIAEDFVSPQYSSEGDVSPYINDWCFDGSTNYCWAK